MLISNMIYLSIQKVIRRINVLRSLPLLEIYEDFFARSYSLYLKSLFHECGSRIYISPASRLRGLNKMKIGSNFYAGRGLWLESIPTHLGNYYNPEVVIGSNFSVSKNFHLAAIGKIIIGNNVLIGSNVTIIDHSHGCYSDSFQSLPSSVPSCRPLSSKAKPIVVHDNVWICDCVTVLGGVEIGAGSVVAANSLVNKNVPPACMVGGVPARLLKSFDKESGMWISV